MTNKRTNELFNAYFYYWIVKLNLQKKYIFNLRPDNRLTCYAYVEKKDKKTYDVRYNVSYLKSESLILRVVLHEIGHMLFDWRYRNEASHEAEAEYFALSTIKENYPKKYKHALNSVKKSLTNVDLDEIHRKGYIEALQRLNEL